MIEMNQVLNHDRADLESRKALITAQEIENQPKVWKKLAGVLESRKAELSAFSIAAISGKKTF